jgi:predicted HicB family RNase H-like nuclease
MKKPAISIQKPTLPTAAAIDFAEAATKTAQEPQTASRQGVDTTQAKKTAKTGKNQVSGLVPEGDVRLTANISEEHHIKLKIAAAKQRTTIGELIEQLIDKSL